MPNKPTSVKQFNNIYEMDSSIKRMWDGEHTKESAKNMIKELLDYDINKAVIKVAIGEYLDQDDVSELIHESKKERLHEKKSETFENLCNELSLDIEKFIVYRSYTTKNKLAIKKNGIEYQLGPMSHIQGYRGFQAKVLNSGMKQQPSRPDREWHEVMTAINRVAEIKTSSYMQMLKRNLEPMLYKYFSEHGITKQDVENDSEIHTLDYEWTEEVHSQQPAIYRQKAVFSLIGWENYVKCGYNIDTAQKMWRKVFKDRGIRKLSKRIYYRREGTKHSRNYWECPKKYIPED